MRDKRRKYYDTEEFGRVTEKELSDLKKEQAENIVLKTKLENEMSAGEQDLWIHKEPKWGLKIKHRRYK